MKRLLSVFFCVIGFTSLFAGGIVTNTNQSASWVRNPSTAAVTGIEATYYNPAATTKLGDGLFFSLSNQSIFQNREIENSYSYLNESKFKGKINAPIFPSIYAVYNIKKLSFSFGFNPIGGGGGAEFKKGLPTIELPPSTLVPSLNAAGLTTISNYRIESYFKGSSIFFGYQFGVSYKINDMISVYAGLRYVTAKNTYEGYLRNIEVNNGGTWMPASNVLAGLSAQAASASASASGAATSTQSIITAGYGGLTLAQAQANTIITATQQAQLEGGLVAFGGNTSMTIAQANAVFNGAATGYAQAANDASINSKLLRNQKADVEQTGSGISPIIGINLSPSDKLNIGIKYEFATKMDIKNKTTLDFVLDSVSGQAATTMFQDGAKTPSDMPSMLSVGISYKACEKLSVSGSFYYYFDKSANYGKKLDDVNGDAQFVANDKVIDNNFMDIAVGLEYSLTDKLLLSTGYLYGKTGVKPEFNTDLNYSLSSHTFGVGGKYSISPKMDVNLGVGYTAYQKSEKTLPEYGNATESYLKNTLIIGVGVDIKFGK